MNDIYWSYDYPADARGDVAEISGQWVTLRAGTLYTALDRLRSDGLIDVDREEVVDNRLRRYYRLTPEGGRRLAAGASIPASIPASTSAELERWYRRLVACYPRSFRSQDIEEIITVLLATVREGQRRPSLAEAADHQRRACRLWFL